ncbi:MAG TPA: OpgC domain-containing protein [Aquamicrobium sp.]|nr:OpgC domain-containing protein [Aquamicrobium sp.]
MTVPVQKPRDTRIDVLRALALVTIFVNHVPSNALEQLTTKNFGFSDAAEAFVLISGVSAALAYGPKFLAGAGLAATLRMWRRAGVLYIAQLGTTMATLGIFAFFSLHYAVPELMTQINIRPVIEDTAAALVGIVTLGHQLGYNNILSMYAAVLVLLPAFLLIGRRFGLAAMVAASGAVWLAAGVWRIGPPNFPNQGVWFLNPLSWQFLFVVGVAAALHVRRGGRLPQNPFLALAAALYLALSWAWVKVPLWGVDTSFGLPAVLTGFDKTYLSAPRLLHVLAAGYLIAVLPSVSRLFRLSPANPLSVMGRHGLPVFVLGTVLAMAAQAWRMVHIPSPASDMTILAVGIGAQFAIAYYIEWYRGVANGWRPAATSGIPAHHDARPVAIPARHERAAAPSRGPVGG